MRLYLQYLHWQAIVDLFALTLMFYLLLNWARSARALRLSMVILGLQVISVLTRQYDLFITSWIFQAAVALMGIVLVVVFQSEWRRAFMLLDRAILFWPRPVSLFNPSFRAVATACFDLAKRNIGALIVILQRDRVEGLITAPVDIDGAISAELIISIFQKNSPLHDGAVIIGKDRIASANAVLPLTLRQDVPHQYGTRHRAAMGLAERSDAFVIVVSEERGTVTVMRGQGILLLASPAALVRHLEASASRPKIRKGELWTLVRSKWKLKAAATLLAVLVWSVSFLAAGTTVRNVSAGIEFVNVPRGLEIKDQSMQFVDVQLRGTPWVMDSGALDRLIGRFNLAGFQPGHHTLLVRKGIMNLPPSVRIDRVSPETLSVRLSPRGS